VATLEGLVVARRPASEAERRTLRSSTLVSGGGVRLGGGSPRARGEELQAPHLSPRGEEAQRAKAGSQAPWREGQALGSGTNTFLAEPLSAATGTLGEENRENYVAFVHLACAQLIFSKILVSG
jgi:hypothetical protein